MLRYIKKHAVLAFLSVLVSIIAQITMPISAVLEQKMIDFIVQRNMDGFAKMLWYAAMVVLATGIAYFLEALTANKFRASMTEELRNDLYDSVMGKSPTSFNERDTAEYISIINNDVNTVSNNFSTPLFKLAGVGFSTGVSLAVMACYSLPLAVLAVLFSLLSFYIPAVLTKHLQKKFVEQTMAQSALSVQLKETLNGHEVISGFGVFEKIRERFSNANRVLTKTLYKIELLVSGLQNSTLVIGRCIKFITFLIAGHMAFRGKITIGTVLLFVSLYEYFSSGIMMFSQVVPLLKGCKPIMDKLTGIVDGKDSTFTGTLSPSFKTQIRIEDLHYAYREDIPVLTGVNLLVRKKEKLVLVGASGCGKSTFIKILSGNYSYYRGKIYYDGVELEQLDHQKLRKVVTVIHQNTYIFNDTIRFNICLGEIFPEEDFQKAISLSGVEKFLPHISGGVDGACGENGVNLSGGQKQRIALARALIRGVDFLILDEGVSAVDVETANEIEQELLDMKDLTLLTITHRIKDGLIYRYDKVLSMADGKIFEKKERYL